MNFPDFPALFKALTGNPPFPWQKALFARFVAGDIPSRCDIPTGLGKTAIVAVWLIALAQRPARAPRRLVYVVNRRTVVDQTTAEVERFCDAFAEPELAKVRDALASLCALPLPTPDAPPLAISTLRGQFADNGEWCADPSRPAVIVGTVDMIGSGLLFSRYTRGFKARPLHGGFLGQDALLVHDEAHLEPSFQELLNTLVNAQATSGDSRKLRVIELTATSRSAKADAKPFGLDENPDDKDTDNEIVQGRVNAVKKLSLLPVTKVTDGKDKANVGDVHAKIVDLALAKNDSNRAVVIFVRSVEAAVAIKNALDNKKCSVVPLTGTMRGKERDELVSRNPVFQRFLPEKDRGKNVTPAPGTVFLVATSAGEVGVNLSGDDLICDLSTYESMAQRFGRVNRFGERDDSEITVVYRKNLQASYDEGLAKAQSAKKDADKKVAAYQRRNQADLSVIKTLVLLKDLGDDASPAALDALPANERAAAFSPAPAIRVATEIQFDAWALTSIREPIAARPPVASYLHGEAEWQPPETHVAWRKDPDVIDTAELRTAYPPADLLEDFPLKPQELLRDTSERIYDRLLSILRAHQSHGATIPDAWLIRENGSLEVFPLTRLLSDQEAGDDGDVGNEEEADEAGDASDAKKAEKARKNRTVALLADATLILPESLGGIQDGLFTPNAVGEGADVSDIPGQRLRVRSAIPDVPEDQAAAGSRLIRTIDTKLGEEHADDAEECAGRYWLWLEAKAPGATGTRATRAAPETLAEHTAAVVANTAALAAKLLPAASASPADEPDLRRCLVFAARWHDLGKNRAPWQRNLGNFAYDPAKPETILAKSAPGMRPRNLAEHYRHEFGSLNDAATTAEFATFSDTERDIVLHLIAAHHGRARPHFPTDEIGDFANNTANPGVDAALATETPRRFTRLQKRFGRWGLAWLESLLRAADYAASAGIVAAAASAPAGYATTTADSQVTPSPLATTTAGVVPTATIAVNPSNPGHYFACCGLFELAARLSSDALAWFEHDATTRQWRFHLGNTPPLADLLEKIAAAEIKCLDEADNHSAVEIALPRVLRLDWWRYEKRGTGKLKTWAGRQGAFAILAALRDEVAKALPTEGALDFFYAEATPPDAVSYFDAPRSANAAARDVGFSMDKLKKGGVVYQNVLHPSVEFFCLVGLQRTRPALLQREVGAEQTYAYYLWLNPLPAALLPTAATGLLPDCEPSQYRFTNPSRTKDYLAFTPANFVSVR
jgi:CRISPR-associated endonuclease/helicase Cas3